MNKNFIIAGAVVLVLGLAIAIGVTLSSEPVAAGLPEGEISVVGDSLPQYAGENDDNVALGLAAPTFSAPDQNSEIFQLEKNGNSKALLFLAHWCPHCQREVPVVQRFIDSNDRGRDNYPPQEWLQREGWSETQIYDLDREIGEAYGLNAFPYWVFLDKDLNVLARRTGNLPEDMVGALLIQLANQ